MDAPVLRGGGGSADLIALLSKLPVDVRMGREYAALGNYETALRYFETAVSDAGRVGRMVSDAHEKQKWSQVRDTLHAPPLAHACAPNHRPPPRAWRSCGRSCRARCGW
jgi:hypothetical protein